MPYIKDNDRRLSLDGGDKAQNAGELNYQISRRILKGDTQDGHTVFADIIHYCDQFLSNGAPINYQKYNDMAGALINSMLELKRRYLQMNEDYTQVHVLAQLYREEIGSYEDTKIIENGDIL